MWDIVEVPREESERSENNESEGVSLKEDGVSCSLSLETDAGKEEGDKVVKVEGVSGPEERPGEGGLGFSRRLSFCCSTCLVRKYFACSTPGDTSSTVVWVSKMSEVSDMDCRTSASTFLSDNNMPSLSLLLTSCGITAVAGGCWHIVESWSC